MATLVESKTDALWEKLRRPGCTRCPLHESAETVCLLGDGPTPARWMAIGEAPGEREDEVWHIPFSGPAGEFLDETLAENGLDRSQFYVTNAAKCRPPNNRKPKSAEIAACNVYLRAELRIHKPEYVLILGDAALKATLGMKGLMANRQRVIERDGVRYFVALHPAAGLHRPAYKRLFRDDIAAFARIVGGTAKNTTTAVHLVNNEAAFKKFLAKLMQAPIISFDIETDGNLYLTRDGKPGTMTIFGAAFKQGEAYVVPLDHAEGWAPNRWKENAARIANALFNPIPFTGQKKKLIAHNGKFDLGWFLEYKPDAEYTFDTMFAAFLLDENRSVSLENLSMGELQVKPWKSDVQYRRDFPLNKYAIYNAKDCDYTLRLYYLYRPKLLEQSRLGKVFKYILMPSANIFARIEARGVYIPAKRLQERTAQAVAEEQEIVAKLQSYVPKRLLPSFPGRRFNPRSSIQMAQLFYSKEGLNIPFPTEAHPKYRNANKGLGSTAEGPMKLIKHPITAIVERWRYLNQKVLSTYFYRWRAMRDLQGFVHFTYNLIGAVTGRISSDLHQTPRDPFVRGVLSVESDDWVWGSADFSQAEMRVAAHLSQDPRLLHIFRTAEVDVHTNTAMKITGLSAKEVTGEPRKKAKAVNFGFLYRMFEKKFRDYAREKFEVELTMQEARAYRRAYFDEYAQLEPWHNKQIHEAMMNGEVKYLDGRLRRLPDIWSLNDASRQEAERQAINSPVQGIVSDLALLTMVIGEYGGWGFDPIVDENFQWQGSMHDEVVFKVRKGYEKEKSEQVKLLMETLPLKKLFGFEFTVPIVSEVKLSKAWGEEAWPLAS